MPRFAQDVGLIAGAAAAGQGIAIIAAPLLTRVYPPVAFGKFAIFTAAVGLLCPLVSLRYEWAILVARDDDAARDLLALVVVLLSGSLLVLSVAVLGAAPFASRWTGMTRAELMLFPLAVTVFGLNGTAASWLAREKAFSDLASIRFLTPVGMIAGQTGLGLVHTGVAGLIVGWIGGYLFAVAVASRRFRHALVQSLSRMTAVGLCRVGREHWPFAAISAPSNLLNTVGSQFPSLVFPSLYGLAVTGQYSLAQRVLAQPRDLISRAVNQVYWSDAARLFVEDPDRLWVSFVILNVFLVGAMMPGIALTWYGPAIFSFIFGPGWAEAGRFAGVMIFAHCVGIAAQGTTSLAMFRLNHWMGCWEVLQLVLVGFALFLAWYMVLPPLACVMAISAALVLGALTLIGLNGFALCRARRTRAGGAVRVGVSQ